MDSGKDIMFYSHHYIYFRDAGGNVVSRTYLFWTCKARVICSNENGSCELEGIDEKWISFLEPLQILRFFATWNLTKTNNFYFHIEVTLLPTAMDVDC